MGKFFMKIIWLNVSQLELTYVFTGSLRSCYFKLITLSSNIMMAAHRVLYHTANDLAWFHDSMIVLCLLSLICNNFSGQHCWVCLLITTLMLYQLFNAYLFVGMFLTWQHYCVCLLYSIATLMHLVFIEILHIHMQL